MLRRLIAIACIFVLTCVAWMILGASLSIRSNKANDRLEASVQSIWGSAQAQIAPFGEIKNVIATTPPTVETLAIHPEASKVDVAVDLDHRRKGLLWYATYRVRFNGTYTLRNPDAEAKEVKLILPLPAQDAIYDNLVFTANGQPLRLNYEPARVSATMTVAPQEAVRLNVGYASQGLGKWSYGFAKGIAEVSNLDLNIQTNFADVDFPDSSLAPTAKAQSGDGWRLTWNYKRLLTGYQIALAMPEKAQPGPLAANISFFAPVSLFFFFFVLWLLSTLRGIDIHPMNYFFLAAAFFAFHLLLAYLADHIDIHVAFGIAALVSIGLVVSYLRLVVNPRFAMREAAAAQAVYLVLFSYAFFLKGFTGLAVTIGAILTLFIAMQLTAKVRWEEKFGKPVTPGPASAS